MKFVKTVSTEIINGIRTIKTKFARNLVETSNAANPFGFDSVPPAGLIAIVSETRSNEDPVVIGYINKAALNTLNIGDSINYSTGTDGVLKASIILRNNGTAEILGAIDNMVRFSELETAFNQLKADLNDHIANWNAFAAAYVPGGPAVQGLPPTVSTSTASGADVTPAKIEEIKTI